MSANLKLVETEADRLRAELVELRAENKRLSTEGKQLFDFAKTRIEEQTATISKLDDENELLTRQLTDAKTGHAYSVYRLHEVCDHRLDDRAFRVLMYLRFIQMGDDNIRYGLDLMARHLGIGARTLSRALQTLEDEGRVISTRTLQATRRRILEASEVYDDRILDLTGQTGADDAVERLRSLDCPMAVRRAPGAV